MKWFYNLPDKTRGLLMGASWIPFVIFAITIDYSNAFLIVLTLVALIPAIFFTVLVFIAESKKQQAPNKPDHQDDLPLTEEEKARRAAAEATRAKNKAMREEEDRLRKKVELIEIVRQIDKEHEERAERIAEYKEIIKEFNKEQIAENKPHRVIRIEGLDDTDNSEEEPKE